VSSAAEREGEAANELVTPRRGDQPAHSVSTVARPFGLTPRRGMRISRDARPGRIVRLIRAFIVVGGVILVAAGSYLIGGVIRDVAGTIRTTPRFDPPVLAGQNVPGPCSSGGFYARDQQTIILTMASHCLDAMPGGPLHDSAGRLVGTFGLVAELPDCPDGRFCAPADMITLALAPDRIAWGHLNLVDMGAGGYRTIEQGTRPLTCGDIHTGDHVEVNGREHYRSGTVIAITRYERSADTIFPCMVVTNIGGGSGDSGSAVLVNGLPGGSTSRLIGGYLAFTPLAEGLENLGLVLCTAPDCDLSPNAAAGPVN
jgi:hypothetical protein